jgi:hypothetical protein
VSQQDPQQQQKLLLYLAEVNPAAASALDLEQPQAAQASLQQATRGFRFPSLWISRNLQEVCKGREQWEEPAALKKQIPSIPQNRAPVEGHINPGGGVGMGRGSGGDQRDQAGELGVQRSMDREG